MRNLKNVFKDSKDLKNNSREWGKDNASNIIKPIYAEYN